MDKNTFIEINVLKTKYKIENLFEYLKKYSNKKIAVIFRNTESAEIIYNKAIKFNFSVSYNKKDEVIFCDYKFFKSNKLKIDIVIDYNIPESMDIIIEHIKKIKSKGKYFILYSNRDIVKIRHYNYENYEKSIYRNNMEKLGEVLWFIYNGECLLHQIKKYINIESPTKCLKCSSCKVQ